MKADRTVAGLPGERVARPAALRVFGALSRNIAILLFLVGLLLTAPAMRGVGLSGTPSDDAPVADLHGDGFAAQAVADLVAQP
jgi:hypothetical protein